MCSLTSPARGVVPRTRTLAACLFFFGLVSVAGAETVKKDLPSPVKIRAAYGKLPLQFEPNRGQADAGVRFLARGDGYSLRLTSTGSVLALHRPRNPAPMVRSATGTSPQRPEETRATVLQMSLVGANPVPRVAGAERLPGKVNSFIGKDPKKWRTNIPTYRMVRYENVYPGIDLVYYGGDRKLEYDFVVAPGADPSSVSLSFEGVDRVRLDPSGDLVLGSAGSPLRLRRPLIYQMVDGRRRPVSGGFRLAGRRQLRFQMAAYDTTKPLIIDPVLVYSTYVGGSGTEGQTSIAVDGSGSAYVTGFTNSLDFPASGGLYNTFRGGSYDTFVTKLDPTGSSAVFSTYLGGSDFDYPGAIAVDAGGNAVVTGYTFSPDFPVTPGALFPAIRSSVMAYITKLNPAGSALVYSTYFGGSGADFGFGVAVDAGGNAYVTGQTVSSDFPTTPGAYSSTLHSFDAFVSKLDPGGTTLLYSTLLGGSGTDQGLAIAVDLGGNAYVTGYTDSTDFPTPGGAFATAPGGPSDGFVTKLNPFGSSLLYSTYLGGSGQETGASIAVDGAGNAWITGLTNSDNFPTTPGAFRTSRVGQRDVFVTKMDALGSLAFSTYLGGSGDEAPPGPAIAVDSTGNAFVALATFSLDFPTTAGALFPTSQGAPDAAIVEFDPAGTLVFSTYLGGAGGESGSGIAVDTEGNVYVTGGTSSSNFPTTAGVFQPTFAGAEDAFATKLHLVDITPPTPTATPTSPLPTSTPTVTQTQTPTRTATRTPTPTRTSTPTSTRTSTVTSTRTNTRTSTPTRTPTSTPTPTPTLLTALGPAKVWVGLKNSPQADLRLDLLAEVFVNATQVGQGQLNNVAPGSAGFNNAILNSVPLSLTPTPFNPGDSLLLRISVRRTCSGTSHAAGTTTLWFNGQPIDVGSARDAGSRFDATIAGVSRTEFLRPSFSLSTTAGSSRVSIETLVKTDVPCPGRPFTPFGMWSTTP